LRPRRDGKIGDCRIVVYEIAKAVRIRNHDRGDMAYSAIRETSQPEHPPACVLANQGCRNAEQSPKKVRVTSIKTPVSAFLEARGNFFRKSSNTVNSKTISRLNQRPAAGRILSTNMTEYT